MTHQKKRIFFVSLLLLFLPLLAGCRNSASGGGAEIGPPTGSFVTIKKEEYPNNQIISVDIETGEETVIFSAPDLSIIQDMVATSDGETIYFSYTPPPSINTGFFDRAALYKISVGESEPQLLIGGSLPDEFYTNPTLSLDDRYLFYHRLGQDYTSTTPSFQFGIERLDLQTGESRLVIPNAIWPRISPDGQRIVFITLDLMSQQRGLGVADIDGSNMDNLLPIGQYFDIDSPFFAADGKSVYFSIVDEGPTVSWFEWLLGVNVAHAHTEHNLPSTWWRYGIEDGLIEEVGTEAKIVSHADRHPAYDQILYTTRSGVFALNLKTGAINQIHPGATYGTLRWIPE